MQEHPDIPSMARKLLAAAPAGSEVILFGSRANGTHRPDSDVDFLVIEPDIGNEIREMARLRHCLKGSPVPVDVLVATPNTFKKWRELPTSVYFDIAKDGRRFGRVG
jgi:uncharacterized protein